MSATVRTHTYNGHTVEIERHYLTNTYGRNGNAGGTPKYYWSAKVDGKTVTSGQRLRRLAVEVAHTYVDAEKKGDCYDAAVTTAEDLVGENDPDTVFVCHGRPTGQGHAWVEVEYDVTVPAMTDEQRAKVPEGVPVFGAQGGTVRMVTVIDRSNGKDSTFPRELYYAIGQMDPDEVARYSLDDAYLNMEEFGHYGPWDE
jgi:hypothetical protein